MARRDRADGRAVVSCFRPEQVVRSRVRAASFLAFDEAMFIPEVTMGACCRRSRRR
jgi:hypothetical protein